MEEKNQLNDIILNKGNSTTSSKKVVLAVATLGVILIIVIMLMNTLSSNGEDNLPQAVLPPEPKAIPSQVNDEPLFEEVEVIQEDSKNNDSLNEIAQKLKEESLKELNNPEVIAQPVEKVVHKKTTPKKVVKTVVKQNIKKPAVKNPKIYYIQVGSFSKYAPNKKFLDSVLSKGYEYRYHKVTANSKTLTKVLVGPFYTEKEARKALIVIRSDIEAGAFLTRI